jgi:hypothetical protein
MELEVHRQERIMAPLQLMWEEMESLEQILSKSPQISEYDVVPGGQKAHGRARLAWGPVKWTVDLDVEITDRRSGIHCAETRSPGGPRARGGCNRSSFPSPYAALSSVPGGDTIPLKRLGFGVSMVADPRGSTLLDVLGDDLDERAHTMDRFLDKCSDEEVGELFSAFQEAVRRRAERGAQALA